ncbi:MAG TPA: DUF393 domain-containing protein [Thermoanaerobaculia bacterium]|nr:DUF393 domain-containing protein [Thermoanaerobaculia bacterium]
MTIPIVRFVVAGEEVVPYDGVVRPYTVVYDGLCRICTRSVRLLRRWDRGNILEIVPSQTPGVQARFPWIPPSAYREALQLIGPRGATWQGAEAAEQLIRILPRGRWIAWIFRIPGVSSIADLIYRWIARNRYALGCGEHCEFRGESVEHGDEDRESSRIGKDVQ